MGFIGRVFGRADKIMYYPGCYTKTYLPEILKNYRKILDDLEIEYIMPEGITCCGMPLKEAGHNDEFEENMEKLRNQIKSNKIKKIITNCPECAKILKENLSIETEHITQTLIFNKYKIRTENKGQANYHKQTQSDEETETQALKELGFELQKTDNDCCGSSTAFNMNNPETARHMAQRTVMRAKTNRIITTSPKCYDHLKKSAPHSEVIELSQAAKNSIKIFKKEPEKKEQEPEKNERQNN